MNATTQLQLTRRQRDILVFIVTYWGDQGFPPTIRDICAEFDIASPNGVVCHIRALVRKGLIKVADGRINRGLSVPGLADAAREAARKYLETLS